MNIEKYVDASAFRISFMPEASELLFYLKDVNEAKHLHLLDLSQSQKLQEGKALSTEDFNQRAFLPFFYQESENRLFFTSDENNRENFNVYSMNTESGEITQHTQANGFVLGAGHAPHRNSILYFDRKRNEDGSFTSKLMELSLQNLTTHSLMSDEKSDYKFDYDYPRTDKSGKRIFSSTSFKNLRREVNISEVSLDRQEIKPLLPRKEENSRLYLALPDVSEKGFYYWSEASGYINLFYFDLIQEQSTALSHNDSLTLSDSCYEKDGTIYAAFLKPLLGKDATKLELHTINSSPEGTPTTSMMSKTLKGNKYLYPNKSGLWIQSTGLAELTSLTMYNEQLEPTELSLSVINGQAEELIHSTSKYVEYPSFDGLMIPAYLSIPKSEVKGLIIEAFYGGYNNFDPQIQFFNELGIAVLSPAVRGSWGWGQAWEDKMKGDLGGGEILDLAWGARFGEKELGLKPSQIGLEGGSHGGYAVLRALTMPDNFKGVDSKYPYGFGICWAGFADLIDFHETSWISDWLVHLLGPLAENRDLYIDRSPLTHFDELQAPLFVAHGTNDTRVSPSSMEAFIQKLQTSGKDHTLYMIEGQGHTAGTRSQKIKNYELYREFLKKVLL